MDKIDRKILNKVQEEFPLIQKPFAEIGESVGTEEKEVIERVKRLKNKGYIRRIGPVLEPKKLGYKGILCGLYVNKKKLIDVVEEINRHSGVTHNYEREGKLNLWFTITAKTEQEIDAFLSNIEKKFSLKIYKFPERKVFKIKTIFPV
jgi:DNA-binding Lrp family transcriptional regulator